MKLFRLKNCNCTNQKFNERALFPVALVLACFAISPMAQAVVPAPDGAYGPPAYGTGNTAEGQNALLSLTTGSYNTAVGLLSLRSNTTTSLNTAIGAGALLSNTADQNTATGAVALFHNTTGAQNTANGALALFSNTTGNGSTANGYHALFSNTTGIGNTANGFSALINNTIGSNNTAIGEAALQANTTGNNNTALGTIAGPNSTGNFNAFVGYNAGLNITTASNVIAISTPGANVDNACFIGNIFGAPVAVPAVQVMVDSTGKLGTAISSSRRFKKEIKPMDSASEVILALKPVTFHYKSDKANRPEFGLIAEEVAAVNPDLVVRDKNGEIYTVRYDAVNAMLLNEFLKEYRKVQELEATIAKQHKDFEANAARQQKQIKALTAGLQNVSNHLELRKSAPQTVLNNR